MTGENCFKVFIMTFSLVLEGNIQFLTKGRVHLILNYFLMG